MRDAFGGIVNLTIIVVFLVIVSGYLAYNVNYTKAFKVKNKIISYFEQYGNTCSNTTSDCSQKINKFMKEIGYNTDGSFMQLNAKSIGDGTPCTWTCNSKLNFCYAQYLVAKNTDVTGGKGKSKVYYKVATRINMNIPIIDRIVPSFFTVSGDTKQIIIPTAGVSPNNCKGA